MFWAQTLRSQVLRSIKIRHRTTEREVTDLGIGPAHDLFSVGVGTGAIVALVIISMLIAVVASMLYFKMDTVQALYRRARRFVKSRILGEDGLDVDEDGVTYGDGHAGQMHKANVEISCELEGTHEVDDRDNDKIEDTPLQIPEQCKPDPESKHANL